MLRRPPQRLQHMGERRWDHLAIPLMRSLRRFLAAAATFPGAPGLASSIEMATVLQNVIQRDLLPDPELANPIPGRPRGGRTTYSLNIGLSRAKGKARDLEKEMQDLKPESPEASRRAGLWWLALGILLQARGRSNPGVVKLHLERLIGSRFPTPAFQGRETRSAPSCCE